MKRSWSVRQGLEGGEEELPRSRPTKVRKQAELGQHQSDAFSTQVDISNDDQHMPSTPTSPQSMTADDASRAAQDQLHYELQIAALSDQTHAQRGSDNDGSMNDGTTVATKPRNESDQLVQMSDRQAEKELTRILGQFVEELDDDDFRCKVGECTRHFIGALGWRYHLRNDHSEWLDERKEAIRQGPTRTMVDDDDETLLPAMEIATETSKQLHTVTRIVRQIAKQRRFRRRMTELLDLCIRDYEIFLADNAHAQDELLYLIQQEQRDATSDERLRIRALDRASTRARRMIQDAGEEKEELDNLMSRSLQKFFNVYWGTVHHAIEAFCVDNGIIEPPASTAAGMDPEEGRIWAKYDIELTVDYQPVLLDPSNAPSPSEQAADYPHSPRPMRPSLDSLGDAVRLLMGRYWDAANNFYDFRKYTFGLLAQQEDETREQYDLRKLERYLLLTKRLREADAELDAVKRAARIEGVVVGDQEQTSDFASQSTGSTIVPRDDDTFDKIRGKVDGWMELNGRLEERGDGKVEFQERLIGGELNVPSISSVSNHDDTAQGKDRRKIDEWVERCRRAGEGLGRKELGQSHCWSMALVCKELRVVSGSLIAYVPFL